MKTITKKFYGLCIALIFMIVGIATYGHLNIAYASKQPESSIANENNMLNEKSYCNATIEDNFSDDCIIVVLKEEVSCITGLSQHNLNILISDIDYESVEDLSFIENPSSSLLEHLEKVGFNQVLKITLKEKSKQNVLNTIKIAEQNSYILSAEPNYLKKYEPILSNIQQEEYNISAYSSIEVTPNDPKLDNQWGLTSDNGIGASDAWKITSGNNAIRVGVIDSGINAHEDLQANLAQGYDFFNKNTVTTDDKLGHGTQVAGVIGAVANNGKGIAGVAPNITLVPLQAADTQSSYDFATGALLDAIRYATKLWGTEQQISILNFSVSDFGEELSFLAEIKCFPGVFVWGAGNLGANVDKFDDIWRYDVPNLISVGAIDKNRKRSVWGTGSSCAGGGSSSYGKYVSIFAPGTSIYTTDGTSGYTYVDGTSLAAPFVTGTAALVWSYKPEYTAAEVKDAITKGSLPLKINTPDGEQNVKCLSALGALAYTDRAVKPIEFTGVAKSSSAATWDITISNPNNFEVTVTYNERMCFEDDARNFNNLDHLRTFRLSANGYRTVQINENGTAWFISACVENIMTSGHNVKFVTYTNGLSANGTMNPSKYNAIYGTFVGSGDLVPNYLDMKVLSKQSGVWTISLENRNSSPVSVTYNSKMCFENAAKTFKGLSNIETITIGANTSRSVQIEENGTAGWITAAINYSVDGALYRRISYTNGLKINSGQGQTNTINNNEMAVNTVFPVVSNIPSYLKLKPVARSGFIVYNWNIQISNPNSYAVQVTYNSKMCFEDDAYNFINLNDLVTITIPANSSKTVEIKGNGTAGWITACINYSYNGYEYRGVTCANGLSKNMTTNTPVHNKIMFS